MDDELRDAAKRGDTEMLYTLLRQNPNIFDPIDDKPFVDTPLHIAASSDHYNTNESPHDQGEDASRRTAEFAVEMAILKPSFTRKLNADGLTPMHLALLNGKWSIVRALMTLDPDLVRVKGKGGKTPLHVAAEIAPPQLLAELLYDCPSSIEDVTAQWKTAVHIAVEAEHYDSFEVLFRWLINVYKEDFLQRKDMEGNTVLHVATRTNQTKVVRELLDYIEDDVKNFKGETALDIHERSNMPERSEEIGKVLNDEQDGYFAQLSRLYRMIRKYSSGVTLSEVELVNTRSIRNLLGDSKSREILIVVAVLVATATYQGILSPPGGFWQDNSGSTNSTSNTTSHFAGKIVMGGKSLTHYILTNSSAFIISICLITICMPGDLIVGTYLAASMITFLFTYLYAARAILPPNYGRLRSQLNSTIIIGIVVAIMIACTRLSLAANFSPDLIPAERGELGGKLVRSDEDAKRRDQRNQHGDQDDHNVDAEGAQGPENA